MCQVQRAGGTSITESDGHDLQDTGERQAREHSVGWNGHGCTLSPHGVHGHIHGPSVSHAQAYIWSHLNIPEMGEHLTEGVLQSPLV